MRVMTFNIRGGLGMDGRRASERIAEAVSSQAPDIVCFQEVHQRLPWSGFINQPRLLQRALGMPCVFQRNVNTMIGGYGLAIASRLPVLGVMRHFLPSVGERRGALEAAIQSAQGPVRIWCTHWGLQGEERIRQAARMARWLGAARGQMIVCGDWNERADAPAVRRLKDEARLQDAGAAQDLPTFPADRPSARIDGIFYSAGLELVECRVVETQVSDHRPVVADFA